MSEYTPNLNLFKYNPDTDGKEVFSITQGLNHNWDILDNLGSGRNIGEIVSSTIPLTDAGLHLLDGALIQGDGIYSAFVDYIAELYRIDPYAAFFAQSTEGRTAEQNWQSSVSTYGVCGKFVYDSTNNTVRLPKVTGKIDGTTDINALGDLKPLLVKLPNITGTMTRDISEGSATGALGITSSYGGAMWSGDVTVTRMRNWDFNASRSSSVYSGDGTDTTIHEQAINVLYYIVIATTTKTQIQVDIDEVATDLNGKVNISDLTEVQCVIETYSNGTSWYRVYSDRWCEQGGRVSLNEVSTTVITYLKPFTDTNYSLSAIQTTQSTAADTEVGIQFTPTGATTGTLSCHYINPNTTSVSWQACGYIL